MDIHVYLTGRLGNQLFQYAFARKLQKKYGGKIICNIYDLEHRSEKMDHIPGRFFFELKNYRLAENVEIEDKKPKWFADFMNPIIRIIKKIIPRLYFRFMASRGYILWQKTEYINVPNLQTKEVFLNGWWQDFRFFHEVEKELADEIVPITPPNPNNKYIYDLASKKNSICLTIRGGNYLVPKVRKSLFVCDKEFFYKAIDEMRRKVSNPIFIVFSDDLKWVKEYIKLEEKFPDLTFVYESGKDSVEEKMRMMTACKHFIISNSSFSWWSQYLSRNKDKIVIAPNAWWTNGKKNGLYMDNWILIPVGKNN